MTAALIILYLLQSLRASASIEGIVLKSGTVVQQPLANARLELTEGPGTPLVLRTDSGGRFAFGSLAPGRYRLSVTKDGFVRQTFKSRLTLAAGQQINDIVFLLDPAPTMSGWVRDETGDPIGRVLVQALRRTYDARGNPGLSVIASGLTDDRGQYRIFWLDPGEYYLFVSSLPVDQTGQPASVARSIPPTYFPGVSDPVAAKAVRITLGSEVEGLDFRLRRTSVTAVSGQFVRANTGRTVSGSMTLMPPPEVPSIARYSASTDNTGHFSIANPVSPGPYVAVAKSASGEMLIAFERIEIRALPELPPLPSYSISFRLAPFLQITGRFFVEGGGAMDVRGARLNLTPLQSNVAAVTSPTQANGQFSVSRLVPDSYLVSVSGLPEDVYMKAAVLGDTDILQSPLNLQKQSPALSLQVLLAPDGGRVTATVVDRESQPFAGAQVVLVPDAARRQRPDQYRTAISDDNGQVTIRGIPPGDYKVFAWESIEPNAHLNKDYLRRYEDLGIPIRIPGRQTIQVTSVRTIPPEP